MANLSAQIYKGPCRNIFSEPPRQETTLFPLELQLPAKFNKLLYGGNVILQWIIVSILSDEYEILKNNNGNSRCLEAPFPMIVFVQNFRHVRFPNLDQHTPFQAKGLIMGVWDCNVWQVLTSIEILNIIAIFAVR